MRDWLLAFCETCDVSLSVMVDQHGTVALVCACPPPDGIRELPDELQATIREQCGLEGDFQMPGVEDAE